MKQPYTAIFVQVPTPQSPVILDPLLNEENSQQMMVEVDLLDDLLTQIMDANQRIDDIQSETSKLSASAQDALRNLEQIVG